MQHRRGSLLGQPYLHTRLVLVILDLDHPVVGPGDEVGLVAPVVIVHAVPPLLVSLQGEVRLEGRGLGGTNSASV